MSIGIIVYNDPSYELRNGKYRFSLPPILSLNIGNLLTILCKTYGNTEKISYGGCHHVHEYSSENSEWENWPFAYFCIVMEAILMQ